MRPLLAMALVAGSLLDAWGRSQDATTAEEKSLLGTWVLVSCETGGEKVPERILQGEKVRFIIGRDTLTIKVDGQTKSEDRYILNPAAKPRAIDLTDKGGRKAVGIYSLEGERLRICWAERGKLRPMEFATRPGSGFDLYVFEREKTTP